MGERVAALSHVLGAQLGKGRGLGLSLFFCGTEQWRLGPHPPLPGGLPGPCWPQAIVQTGTEKTALESDSMKDEGLPGP